MLQRAVSVKRSSTFQLTAHMISSVYASIHSSSMIETARCAYDKNAQTTAQVLPAHGHVHAVKNTTSTPQFHKHLTNAKNKENKQTTWSEW